jgi:hypothetical protein
VRPLPFQGIIAGFSQKSLEIFSLRRQPPGGHVVLIGALYGQHWRKIGGKKTRWVIEKTGIRWVSRRPPEPHSEGTPTDPQADQVVTPTPSDACTTACTNNQEMNKATDLDALAAELLALPKEERARLLAKLLGEGDGEGKAC